MRPLKTYKGNIMKKLVALLGCLVSIIFLNAGDFDDGISTYTDDPVSASDETFKKGVNTAYIKSLVNAQRAEEDAKKKNLKMDSRGIITDDKGNMYIDQNSKITPGTTIINAPRGGKNMEGNMVIDPNVKIPIGARVINAPEQIK